MRPSLAVSETAHELPNDDKQDHQRKLCREGVDLLRQGRAKALARRERENRARNITRAASKRPA